MTEDERSPTFQMSFRLKLILTPILFATLIWGCLIKCFICFNISREKFSERPINVLTFVDQIIQLVFGSALLLHMIGKVTNNTVLLHLIGTVM
jgi:hypothetical protein